MGEAYILGKLLTTGGKSGHTVPGEGEVQEGQRIVREGNHSAPKSPLRHKSIWELMSMQHGFLWWDRVRSGRCVCRHDGFPWPGPKADWRVVLFENSSEVSGLEVDFCFLFLGFLESETNFLASMSWRETVRCEQVDGKHWSVRPYSEENLDRFLYYLVHIKFLKNSLHILRKK